MNKHIIEYLDYYLGLEVVPYYAVMLRGNWGSGKSWFIKNYIKGKNEEDFLYVSLYGVTSYKEIEESFFQQLHPVLASKGMKLAGKILKGLLKTTVKIDLDSNGKDETSVNSGIPDINLPDYLRNIDSKIIIFDDLERCAIAISNIMGYVNQFVENNGLKVIIIANEDEIIRLDKHRDDSKAYLSIKEKLIGKSFDVFTDFDSAINDFIAETTNLESKKLLEENGDLFKQLFSVAGYNNLRHLRQTILDFERFHKFLPKNFEEKPDLVKHIIDLFCSMSFEIKKGKIIENDIKYLLSSFSLSKEENENKSEIQEIKEKYPVYRLYFHPIPSEIWIKFFKSNIVNIESLNLSIQNSVYFKDENTPNWMKLWYYFEMEDDEFNVLYNSVAREFKELKILDKYELVQITCLLVSLSNKKLIRKTEKELLKIAKANIKNLKRTGNLKIDKHEEFPSHSSHGLQYSGLELDTNKEFLAYITQQADSLKFDYPAIAQDLLQTMSFSVNEFLNKILLNGGTNNLYYDVPVLIHINSKKFVSEFLKLTNKEKRKFDNSFQNRYKFDQYNLLLIDELDWLKEIYLLLDKEKKKREGKISGQIIEFGILKSIDLSIKLLEDNVD